MLQGREYCLGDILVASYLLLRGWYGNCQMRTSLRYPLIEVLTGLLVGLAHYVFTSCLTTASGLVLIARCARGS